LIALSADVVRSANNRVKPPDLQIVPDELWQAAHARLADSRRYYLRSKGGKLDGNPGKGTESNHLLVGMATCGVCGASLTVTSRKSGAGRGARVPVSLLRESSEGRDGLRESARHPHGDP